jgi:hypothetical protein
MFNSPLFQVALCVLLVFLIMSAIVSVLQQIVIQFFRLRSWTLKRTVRGLISDEVYRLEIAQRFYSHPLTASVSGGEAHATTMDAMTFVTALSTAVQPRWSAGDPIATLPASVAALKDGALKTRLTLILPPAGATRDEVIQSVTAWFNNAEGKMTEGFTSSLTALSYGIATAVTLLFNVSTLHIADNFHSNAQLTAALAAITPTLAATIDQKTTALNAAIAATPADQLPSSQTLQTASADATNLETLVACARLNNELPIGWPWMADLVKQSASVLSLQTAPDTCGQAFAAADASPALKPHVELIEQAAPKSVAVSMAKAGVTTKTPKHSKTTAKVSTAKGSSVAGATGGDKSPVAAAVTGAPAPAATPAAAPSTQGTATPTVPAPVPAAPAVAAPAPATADTPDPAATAAKAAAVQTALNTAQYGPDFKTEAAWKILLGWLITIVAAAQGAPFWFSAIRRVAGR